MGVLETIKDAVKLAQKLGNVEISQALIDAQQAALDLMTENQKLRGELAQLREVLEKEHQLEFHHDTYWLRTAPQTLDGPFSATPWDNDKKLLRMSWTDRGTYNNVEMVRFYLRVNNDTVIVPVSFLRTNMVRALAEQEERQQEHDRKASFDGFLPSLPPIMARGHPGCLCIPDSGLPVGLGRFRPDGALGARSFGAQRGM